jgi:hypothetical protein
VYSVCVRVCVRAFVCVRACTEREIRERERESKCCEKPKAWKVFFCSDRASGERVGLSVSEQEQAVINET